MRDSFAVVLSAALVSVVAVAGCPEPLLVIPQGKVECVLDKECGDGVCSNGACVPAPPVRDAGVIEDPPVSDAGPPDAGPEDAGPPPVEPDAGVPDAGTPDAGPPPPEPQRLRVTVRPEDNDSLAECFCASRVSSANVDLAMLAAAGGTCTKPPVLDCGLTDPGCPCSGPGIGTAFWGSDGPPLEYRPGETWIAHEEIVRESGPDETLTVRATLVDDCMRSPNSTSESVMYACFLLDCENMGGPPFSGPADCVRYLDYDLNTCPNAVANYMLLNPLSADCIARGPAAVRITVDVQGDGGFTKQYCTVMSQSGVVDAVTLSAASDRYEITSVSPDVVEVTPGTVCPPAQP